MVNQGEKKEDGKKPPELKTSTELPSQEKLDEAERIVREHEARLAAEPVKEAVALEQGDKIRGEIVAIDSSKSLEALAPETFKSLKNRLTEKYSQSTTEKAGEDIKWCITFIIDTFFVRQQLANVREALHTRPIENRTYYLLRYEELYLTYGFWEESKVPSTSEKVFRFFADFMISARGLNVKTLRFAAYDELEKEVKKYGINVVGNLSNLEAKLGGQVELLSSKYGVDTNALTDEVEGWWKEMNAYLHPKRDDALEIAREADKIANQKLLKKTKEKLGLPKK